MHAERRFVHVVRVNTHLMISGAKIQLGEVTRSVEFVEQLLDNGYRELVLDGDCVERPIVDAKPPGGVLLLDQQHRG